MTEDCLLWDVQFPVGEGGKGLRAAMELLHTLINDFVWEAAALDKTRTLLAAQHDARDKSLEQAATATLTVRC